MPDAATHQRMTDTKTELAELERNNTSETAASVKGIAAWYRRSNRRSELRLTSIITGSPTRYGIITSKPTRVFEYWLERLFSNCGIQKIIVYSPAEKAK